MIELIDEYTENLSVRDLHKADFTEKFADYLLARGVIGLSCAVGDTVYMPWEFDGAKGVAFLTVTHIIFDTLHAYIKTDLISDCDEYLAAYNYGKFKFSDFGKTVFLTKEDAKSTCRKKQ